MKPISNKEQKAYDKIKEIYEQYGGEVNEILYGFKMNFFVYYSTHRYKIVNTILYNLINVK